MPMVLISDNMNELAERIICDAGVECDVSTGLSPEERAMMLGLISIDSKISDDALNVLADLPQIRRIKRLIFE